MNRRHKKKTASRPAKPFRNRPLEALAELADKLASSTPAPAPARPPVDSDDQTSQPAQDEGQLFAQAMAGVVPLDPRPTPPRREGPQPPSELAAERERREVVAELHRLVEQSGPVPAELCGEHIEGAAPGVQRRLLAQLRRGYFSVQDHLDLHGLTREQARSAVETFLEDSRRRGLRCVLIIHGRGKRSAAGVPVLKNSLNDWLSRSALRKRILAFASARPCDGGAGAVYVLLRRLG